MTHIGHARPMGFLSRCWIYQRERFPLAAHGISVAAFAAASVAYGHMLAGATAPGLSAYAVAGIVLLCQFFLLRVADEFKDAETDGRFRPERPVPRGLIGLGDLFRLGLAAAGLQIVSIFIFDMRLLPWLALVWLWFGLMAAEFFASAWLRARPLLYMASHMAIMPLLALLAMSAGAPAWQGGLPFALQAEEVWIFCAFAFASGVLLEVGRKIRAPEEERPGVETYSALWGRRGALALWLLAAAATSLLGRLAAAAPGTSPAMNIICVAGLMAATVLAVLHHTRPRPLTSALIERFSGLFVLTILVTLAVLCTGRL